MDDRRFDNLTRLFGQGASRRSVLRGLLGLGGAAAAGSVVSEADARTLRTRNTVPPSEPVCPADHQLCDGTCCPNGRCFDGLCCQTAGTSACGGGCCPDGLCTSNGICCDIGLEVCGTACCTPGTCARSGNTDICCEGTICGLDCCGSPDQCCDGECCAAGSICIGEERCCPLELMCGGVCCNGEGQTCCEGVCLEAGQCCDDEECPDNPAACQIGICAGNSCGLSDACAGQSNTACCDETCIPLGTSTDCRTCGDACVSGENCCGDSGCVDTATSDLHCGGCDNACTSGLVCFNGHCICDENSDCGDGQVCCNGACQECCGSDASPCGDGDLCKIWSCNAGQCESNDTITCDLPAIGDCFDAGVCNAETGTCDRQALVDGMPCGAVNDAKMCCSQQCVDINKSNCYACGNVCTDLETCSDTLEDCFCDAESEATTCAGSCAASVLNNCGYAVDCSCELHETCCPDAGCVDLLTSNAHCGACGNACESSVCFQGTCYDGCVINGVAYADGTLNPASECQQCDASSSRTNWTRRGSLTNQIPCSLGCYRGFCIGETACSPISTGGGGCQSTECSDATCGTDNVCRYTPKNEEGACTPSSFSTSPCRSTTAGTCRSGSCVGNAVNDGVSCIPLDREVCHSPFAGTCDGGSCVPEHLPDGTICDENPTACWNDTCIDGACTGTTPARSGEPCLEGITQCRADTFCSDEGACVSQGNFRSFCTDSGLSYCEDFRLTEGGACNGDGTCTHYGTFANGQVRCEGINYSRECCPGMICECPPQSGAFCVEKFCYYP